MLVEGCCVEAGLDLEGCGGWGGGGGGGGMDRETKGSERTMRLCCWSKGREVQEVGWAWLVWGRGRGVQERCYWGVSSSGNYPSDSSVQNITLQLLLSWIDPENLCHGSSLSWMEG